MKLEIEISEEAIREALSARVLAGIIVQSQSWGAEQFLRDAITKAWRETTERLVAEKLTDPQAIQDYIDKVTKAKIKHRVNKALAQLANLQGPVE